MFILVVKECWVFGVRDAKPFSWYYMIVCREMIVNLFMELRNCEMHIWVMLWCKEVLSFVLVMFVIMYGELVVFENMELWRGNFILMDEDDNKFLNGWIDGGSVVCD